MNLKLPLLKTHIYLGFLIILSSCAKLPVYTSYWKSDKNKKAFYEKESNLVMHFENDSDYLYFQLNNPNNEKILSENGFILYFDTTARQIPSLIIDLENNSWQVKKAVSLLMLKFKSKNLKQEIKYSFDKATIITNGKEYTLDLKSDTSKVKAQFEIDTSTQRQVDNFLVRVPFDLIHPEGLQSIQKLTAGIVMNSTLLERNNKTKKGKTDQKPSGGLAPRNKGVIEKKEFWFLLQLSKN